MWPHAITYHMRHRIAPVIRFYVATCHHISHEASSFFTDYFYTATSLRETPPCWVFLCSSSPSLLPLVLKLAWAHLNRIATIVSQWNKPFGPCAAHIFSLCASFISEQDLVKFRRLIWWITTSHCNLTGALAADTPVKIHIGRLITNRNLTSSAPCGIVR